MILKNANIITMHEEVILSGYDILIGNGLILRISKEINTKDDTCVDCKGKYIMPGLYDMHVHIDSPTMAKLLFANGVTKVRNMWGREDVLELARNIESGKVTGPDIISASPIIDGINSLETNIIVTTEKEARQAVDEAVIKGYKYIKTYPDIEKNIYLAIVDQSKKHNIKIVGHGNNYLTTDELINSYFSLEHTTRLPDNDDDIVKIAKSGMWFVPTHTALENLVSFVKDGKEMKDIGDIQYIDSKLKDIWQRNITRYKSIDRFKGLTNERFCHKAMIFAKYSGKILLGTDTPMPGVVPGFAIHRELENMVNMVGLSNYQAILTGTVNASDFFGESNTNGTVEQGKRANLIILDANPLDEIMNSRRISAVIKDGILYGREQLDNILSEVKEICKKH